MAKKKNNWMMGENICEDMKSSSDEHPSPPSSIEQDATHISLELEKMHHELKANLRMLKFESITSDSPIVVSSAIFGFYLVGTLIICFLCTIPTTIIPHINFVRNQASHYEITFQNMFIQFFTQLWLSSLATMLYGKCLNIDNIQTGRSIMIVFIASYASNCLYFEFAYSIWTNMLHHRYPIPFNAIPGSFVLLVSHAITIWSLFPSRWRENNDFAKRCIYFKIGGPVFLTVVIITYIIIASLFLHFKNEYQPIFILPLYIMKNVNLKVLGWLQSKVSSGDLQGAKIISEFLVTTIHAVFICITMSSITTYTTAWCIIAFKILTSISISLKIVWKKTYNTLGLEEQVNLLQKLAINDLVEFIVPLVFLVTVVTAYYGPNSEILGNISSDLWHYTSIQDIKVYVERILIFFLTDVFSLLLCSIILLLATKINLYKVIIILENEFGNIFCLIIGTGINYVSTLPYCWPLSSIKDVLLLCNFNEKKP